MSHVIAHQRVTSADEGFTNQVNRKTPSVVTRQPLSPATTVIAQWAHEQSGLGGRYGGYTWAQQHRLPLTKANLPTATDEQLSLPAAETNTEPLIWHHSPGRPGGRLITSNCFHHGRGRVLFLLE